MKKYLEIIKPKIILSNLISVSGGFFLSSKNTVNYHLFFFVLFGSSLLIASACVFNNYIDRDIDKYMQRTKNRALVLKKINLNTCLLYGFSLGIFGELILYFYTNFLTLLLSFVGFFIYVVLYSLIFKKKSIHSIIIGSFSGSIPPLIGYCSVSNNLQKESIILLLIFVLWQIPHSYAIFIFRFKDYQKAKIPTLPLYKGTFITKIYILIYIFLFTLMTMLLKFFNYTNYKYFFVTSILNIFWLGITICKFKKNNEKIWAKKIFIFSIIVIIFFNIMISIDSGNKLKKF